MTVQQAKFKDLSEPCKQKLIELHRKSVVMNIENIKTCKVESFDEIVSRIDTYQSDKLKKNLSRIAEYLESNKKVKDVCEVEDKIMEILNDLQSRIESYDMACKDDAFLEELKKAYMGLSGRFLEIRSKYKK